MILVRKPREKTELLSHGIYKLDGAFGVTPVAGGCWPPGNQRDSKEGQFLKAKGEGLLLEKRKRG